MQAVEQTLAPGNGSSQQRQQQFDDLQQAFSTKPDPVYEHMAKVMASFQPGLFAGGDLDLAQDNLDLERFFRLPKGHERRIHGHRHAGVRIVLEGPTLVLALNAHQQHPEPFTQAELVPYRTAQMPTCQRDALARRTTMRKARSPKQRPNLLADLERRYNTS